MITKMSTEAKEFFIKEIKKGKTYICPLGSVDIPVTKAIHQVTPENPFGKPEAKLHEKATKALISAALMLLFSYEK